MTVAELIEELKKQPQDAEVRIESSSGEYPPCTPSVVKFVPEAPFPPFLPDSAYVFIGDDE